MGCLDYCCFINGFKFIILGMSEYTPPVKDMLFILNDVLGFQHEDLDPETCEAVLDEAAKLASEVLAPINKIGDEQGATLKNGNVKTADGFKEAYKAYCDGGWNAVPFNPEYGGQGLPWALAFPIQEMWQGANMSFGLCPLLNQGAIEAIAHHGSQEQKDTYLEKLILGEWTGTMNLTEPGAGSDLGLIRSKAEPKGDAYKISGQKIFITYGDHDLTENIIHLVLARLPDAEPDVKGISLFIVPKILEDGTRNTVNCIGLEHKLGIHASPTCTMEFDGATGYLIGEAGQGVKCMFTMMNNARLSVGLQGVAIAERALQQAIWYAKDRVQGKSFETGERVAIIEHPDVQRMILDMQSRVMAGRLMTYDAAMALEEDRARADFLTPIVKSWCTDMAVNVTSTGLQVHGGMGFVEETGAAQYFRDARILPIYEGTNGIQAMDLVFRKTLRDQGKIAFKIIKEMDGYLDQSVLEQLNQATGELLKKDIEEIALYATPYLNAFATIFGAYMLKKASELSTAEHSIPRLSEFYEDNILAQSYVPKM